MIVLKLGQQWLFRWVSAARAVRMKHVAAAMAFSVAGPAVAGDFEAGLAAFEQGRFTAAFATMGPLAEQGNAQAQYMMGVLYSQGLAVAEDRAAAADWFRRAAKHDHVEAQVELAHRYRDGDGVPRDLAQMTRWYRRAAEQGHVGAQLYVADAYAYGHGVGRDYVQAYAWYQIAAHYWGDLIAAARDAVAAQMKPEQIARAEELAARLLTAAE